MNKKAHYLIILPSAIVFFTLFASRKISSVVIAFLAGLILGVGECVYLQKNKTQDNRWQPIVSAFVGLFVCYLAVEYFYNIWISSTDLMRKLVTRVFPDYGQGLLIISIFIGLIAFPFAFYLVSIILHYIICIIDYKKLKLVFWENISIASVLKKAGILFLNISIAAFIGTLLLVAVYKLPVSQINDNVKVSANTIKTEGTYPRLSNRFTSQLDNFTESIMLLETANNTVSSPLVDAMNVPRGCIEEEKPVAVLTAHYIDEIEFDGIINYSRYWHGYLIFLKPLFLFFNYNNIRIINGITQVLLVIVTGYLLYRRGLKYAVIPYILSYCMLMPVALAKSFQFSSCFYVFTIGCIVLLLLPKEKLKEKSYLVFLYCGVLTAYFDLLTYPIATFGVPMVFCLLLEETESTESKLSHIIKSGLIWCIGFGCMWVAKWIIGSVITGNNVMADALARVAMRTSNESVNGETHYGVFKCEKKNYRAFFTTPVTLLVAANTAYLIIRNIKDNHYTIENLLRILFPFLLVSLAPIVWYAFTTNHSTIHVWFTNKACITSLLAILFGLVCLLQSQNKGQQE